MIAPIQNRYDFVYLFDVENGNPNGDPDAGNMPRLDPETSFGLVTDVCLKRKIRNYVGLVKNDAPGYSIYVREKAILNQQHELAYKNNPDIERPAAKKLPKKREEAERITRWMCDNFFDVRTFGAVMSTEVNCGQVRGPVQIGFGTSQDPIVPLEITITRVAVTREGEDKEHEMGRKHIVPYGLYRTEGYVSAHLAAAERSGTGFSEEDLALLWEALKNMFDHDHSAARGKMAARKLIVFKHAAALGNAPAHQLFERVRVERTGDADRPPRGFADYAVILDRDGLLENVTMIEML